MHMHVLSDHLLADAASSFLAHAVRSGCLLHFVVKLGVFADSTSLSGGCSTSALH